jgi:hypothetical protein
MTAAGLAASVIRSAVADLSSPLVTRRASAEAFFKPTSEGLQFWCSVADLDPAFVVTRVLRIDGQARQEPES